MATDIDILAYTSMKPSFVLGSHRNDTVLTPDSVLDAMKDAREDEALAFLEWYWTYDMEEQDELLDGIPDNLCSRTLYNYWKSTLNQQL